MNSINCFAATLLIELFLTSEQFASCVKLAETIKETKYLLSFPGWKDIVDNAKTNTAEGEFGDDDVAKLVNQNEDIDKKDITVLVQHIFFMMNCRYASRLLFLSSIISDLATVCGYSAFPDPIPQFTPTPLVFCEQVLYYAFELSFIDLTYAYSAIKYFQTLSPRKIGNKSLRPINRSFKWNCEQLLDFYRRSSSPATIKTQLQSTVSSLQAFNKKLMDYFGQNCLVETGYPDLLTRYRFELDGLKQQSDLRQLFIYFQKKIIEVSDDITENNFKDCGFLYNSETQTCSVRQPETSTS